MLFSRAGQAMLLCAALAVSPAFASRVHRPSTSGHVHQGHIKKTSARRGRHRISFMRTHGQREIDSARATEIQAALVREKYLTGAPSGQWDVQTQAAMQKYQADHGWQTKITPDSRALINLGLGPNHTTDVAQTPNPSQANGASAIQAQSPEPMANTLASVHSISQ